MLKLICITLLTPFTLLAITPIDFANKVIKTNANIKIGQAQMESVTREIEANWSRYTPQFVLKGAWSKDQSDPLTPQLPHHAEIKSADVSISQNGQFGIIGQIGLRREDSTMDQTTNSIGREKSELSVGLSIDLMKNITGRVDRKLQNNWNAQKKISSLQFNEKKEELLYQSLSLFSQYNYLYEQQLVTREIEKNAQYLLALANKRKTQGLNNQREILIYQSNLSGIQNNLLAIESNLRILSQRLDELTEGSIGEGQKYCRMDSLDLPDALPSSSDKARLREKIIENQIMISEHDVSIADYQILPDLKLKMNWMGIGNQEKWNQSWQDSYDPQKDKFAVELQLTIPFSFEGERARKSAKLALLSKNKIDQSKYKYELERATSELHYQYALAKKRIIAAKKHSDNESQKYLNELLEFKKGMRNTMDLIQFQNDYLRSKLQSIEGQWSTFTLLNQYLVQEGMLLSYYQAGSEK